MNYWHMGHAIRARGDNRQPHRSCTMSLSRGAAARLLVVDTQTCGSFMRAKVSLGPPKHAAQLGAAGATQPAASNTCTPVYFL